MGDSHFGEWPVAVYGVVLLMSGIAWYLECRLLLRSETVKFTADWGCYWRNSLDDAFYSIAVFPLRPGEPSRARFIGSSPALTLIWEPTRHITVLASCVHFLSGPYLKENPPSKDIDYATTWITYKF